MNQVRYWRARLVKDGPFIGVKTFFSGPVIDGEELDRAPRWQALVGHETTARAILMGDYIPIEVDGANLRNLERIEEHEHRFLISHAGWAVVHAPDRAEANPREPVDFNTLKVR